LEYVFQQGILASILKITVSTETADNNLTERIGGLKDEKNLSAQKTSQKDGARLQKKNV